MTTAPLMPVPAVPPAKPPAPSHQAHAQINADVTGVAAPLWKRLLMIDILKGLWVSGGYMFKPKISEQYPEERRELPYRSRGRLHVDIDLCISCKLCEEICPDSCIVVTRPPKEVFKKDKRPSQFTINQDTCMYCGLCVDPCPTASIHHTPDFEFAVFDRRNMFFDKAGLPYELQVDTFELPKEWWKRLGRGI